MGVTVLSARSNTNEVGIVAVRSKAKDMGSVLMLHEQPFFLRLR
jgi:hypothetical protein